MGHVESIRSADFVTAALEDKRLSFCAKGVLWHLVAKNVTSPFSYETIRIAGRDGRADVYLALRELEDHGYLRSIVGPFGMFGIVHAIPDLASGGP